MPEPIRPLVLAALAVALVGGCSQGAAPAPEAAPAAAPAPAPAPPTPTVSAGIGAGEWLVGTQVQPGTYSSTGPAKDGDYCMWSRKDAAGAGAMNGIIASDGTYDPGQMLVTIEPTDVVFLTRGCAPFERVAP